MSEVKTNEKALEDIFNDLMGAESSQGLGGGDDPNPAKGDEGEGVEEPVNKDEPIDIADPTEEPAVNGDDKPTDGTETSTGDKNVDTEDPDKSTDPDLFDDWFDDPTPDTPDKDEPEPTVPDYTELAKEIGLEVESKEQLIESLKKIKEDAAKAEEFSKLPPDIVQAIELAKKNQDYKEVFKESDSIDHSVYDDRTLLINQNAKFFTDKDGNVNVEALTEYVDEMTEVQQKIEAAKVREQIDQFNLAKREERIRQKREAAQRAELELKSTISEVNDVKGFKVTPQHKEEAFKAISSGEAMNEMFRKADGSYDMKKIFETYFIVKNFDKIKSYLVRRAKDDARVEDFRNISNADVNTRQARPDVKPEENKDLASFYLDVLKQKAGLNK